MLTTIVQRAHREGWGIARITIALRPLMKGPKMDLVEAFRLAADVIEDERRFGTNGPQPQSVTVGFRFP